MNIVIDGRFYGLENAGPGRYTKELIDTITELDNKNNYIILLRKKYFDQLNFRDNIKKLLTEYEHYTITEQLRLPLLLYKLKPDIVHFPFFNVPVFYFGNFVTTIHDLTMHKFKGKDTTTRNYPSFYLWRLAYRVAFAKAVHGSRALIVPSKFVKGDLIARYKINPGKITVIYEGVDKKFTIDLRNSTYKLKNYFLYVGSAYPHKNLETVIKAVKKLNEKSNKKYILAIASSRSVFLERIEKLADNLNASEYVKFLGFVSDAKLVALYKNSLAFVYPTVSEGFGLPSLEAMAAGTLVIASDIEVLREIYDGNAIFFDPKKSSDLVEKMKYVVNLKKEERQKKIKASQEFVQKYSWETMAKETIEVYNRLL